MKHRQRKILIAIALLAVGLSLGLFTYALAPNWRARQAVSRFQNCEQASRISVVRCKYEWEKIRGRIEIEPGGPSWLQWLRIGKLGPFDKVRRVWLTPLFEPSPQPLPSCFADIQYFPGLISLDLMDTTTSDADLAVVAKCQSIERINLSSTLVTDAGLEHVCKLPKLRTLLVLGTNISDAGLARISQCNSLQSLLVSGPSLTDVGVESLVSFSELRQLFVAGQTITDRSAAAVSKMTSIEVLYLDRTNVSDEGLRTLVKIS